MAGLLDAYDSDDDDDEDQPSIVAQQSMQGAQAVAAEPVASDASAEAKSSPQATTSMSAAAVAAAPAPKSSPGETSVGTNAGSTGRALLGSPLANSLSSPSSDGAASPAGGGGDADDAAEEELLALPPSPPGEPDPELLERVRSLHDLRRRGKSIRDHIQGSRDWSNPYILEKVIKVFEIDEHGSNYPKEIFDPSRIAEHPSDYFDAPECERPPLPKRARKQPIPPASPAGLS